tara:strand:+ start:36157 stop:36660 length:504 start_codon:yes stop_codon:yes gene_type:complete
MQFNNSTYKRLNVLLILLLVLAITSCERDDICIDEITPNFVLRFYDIENIDDTKNVNQLSVQVLGVDNDSLVFTGLDSIAIPLKVTENTTQYILTIMSDNVTNSNRDTLTLNYTQESIFVGRSCGYKSVFNNVTYQLTTDSDNWIEDLEIVNNSITNETAAHVKIFH